MNVFGFICKIGIYEAATHALMVKDGGSRLGCWPIDQPLTLHLYESESTTNSVGHYFTDNTLVPVQHTRAPVQQHGCGLSRIISHRQGGRAQFCLTTQSSSARNVSRSKIDCSQYGLRQRLRDWCRLWISGRRLVLTM